MPLMPMYLAPGICKTSADYSSGKTLGYSGGRYAQGRYVDGNFTRFTAGFPEKIGGWQQVIASGGVVGTIRTMRAFLDYARNTKLIIGTESHLYVWDGTSLTDITPAAATLGFYYANNVTTTINSPVVTFQIPSTTFLQTGDWVLLSTAAPVGGLTINGWYQVILTGGVTTSFTIRMTSEATSSATSSGFDATYPRTNYGYVAATIAGSSIVQINVPIFGTPVGAYANFLPFTVGGLTINGQYLMTTYSGGGGYFTINAGSPATSTASGGGPVVFSQNAPIPGMNGQKPNWSIWNYGNLILASYAGGLIYIYDAQAGGTAYPLLNAPSQVITMVVTPERFVVALGTAYNPTQVSWADQNDFTNWTTSPTNTAETGRSLQGGSTFVGAYPVRDGVTLILTDTSVFQMTYSGDTFVYDTPLIADNAGLIAVHAIAVQGEIAYWMGDRDFWTYSGSVEPLPSDDIRDYVFRNLNVSMKYKCFAASNRIKKEVWFFYVSSAGTEIDSYVIYHIDSSCWSIGKLERTSWIEATLFPEPYASDVYGNVFQHETGTDANGSAMYAYLQTSPMDVSNGDSNMDIMGYIPDFQRLSGYINLTILTRYYPQDSDTLDGPYVISPTDQTPRIDLRSDGKMAAVLLESNTIGGDFRLGQPRIDVTPAGVRR